MKSRFLAAAGALAFAATAASLGFAQAMPEMPPQPPQLPPAPMPATPGSPYVIYPIRNGVFMISGPVSNSTVQIGAEGVLVVDTGPKEGAEALVQQVRRLTDKPILYVINTNGDADMIGGNSVVAKAGVAIDPRNPSGSGGAPIWSHEGVLTRLIEQGVTEGVPTVSYFVGQKDLFFNGEPVSLIHAPGHTKGDSFVMFRRSDVVSAGGIYSPDRYPAIDAKNGGSIQQLLNSLNDLIDLTVTEYNQEGGTYVVPAHGRLSDEADVADYRDMVTFIHDRVKDMVGKRMSLAQVKAARPTTDYDPLYGKEAGDAFVEQIYLSLTSKGAKK